VDGKRKRKAYLSYKYASDIIKHISPNMERGEIFGLSIWFSLKSAQPDLDI
jgi:hypothetical protein